MTNGGPAIDINTRKKTMNINVSSKAKLILMLKKDYLYSTG